MKTKITSKEKLQKELSAIKKRNAVHEKLLETHRKKIARLKDQMRSLEDLFNNSRDGIYSRDSEGKYLNVNQSMLDIFGYTRDEIRKIKARDLYYDKKDLPVFEEEIQKKGYVKDYEVRMRKKNGREVYCMATVAVLYSPEGEKLGYHGIIRDITKYKKAELENLRLMKELHSMSFIDDLTGLYNRRGFFSLSPKQLETARRLKRRVFIIFIDMDNMKWINDMHGHSEGDRALIDAARILKMTYREADVIARMGGDEFAIIAMEFGETSEAHLYSKLIKNIDAYNNKTDRDYKLSMSVGIAQYNNERNISVDGLLSAADSLMYENKRSKRDTRYQTLTKKPTRRQA